MNQNKTINFFQNGDCCTWENIGPNYCFLHWDCGAKDKKKNLGVGSQIFNSSFYTYKSYIEMHVLLQKSETKSII